MITTRSSQEGLTFHHDGTPDGGKLKVVIDTSKIFVERDTFAFNGTEYLTLNLEYNAVRDFTLNKLRDRKVSRLEQMDDEELARYLTA